MCRRRKQQLQNEAPARRRQRGCCSSRLDRRINATTIQTLALQPDPPRGNFQPPRPMAALLAVGIGLGAEKLGRRISEKRLDWKEKKHAQQREALHDQAESSTAQAAQNNNQVLRSERKSAEVQREQNRNERRRSVSSDRTGVEEPPPPRYEDVVRDDGRRA